MTPTAYVIMFLVFGLVVLPIEAALILYPDRTLRVHRHHCPNCVRSWTSTERRCPWCAQYPPVEAPRIGRHVLRADRRVQEMDR